MQLLGKWQGDKSIVINKIVKVCEQSVVLKYLHEERT